MKTPSEVVVSDAEIETLTKDLGLAAIVDYGQHWRYLARQALAAFIAKRVPDAQDVFGVSSKAWSMGHNACRERVLTGDSA